MTFTGKRCYKVITKEKSIYKKSSWEMHTAAAAERGQEEIVVIMHQVCFLLAWGILKHMDAGYTQDLDNGGAWVS